MAEQIRNLRRKRSRERSNITRFSNTIHSFTDETTRDDLEHYRGRLEEALESMLKLDDTIHDSLTDEDYDADVTTCEEYIEADKRAIQKAGRGLEKFTPPTTGNPIPNQTIPPVKYSEGGPNPLINHHVKLPPSN
jgi:hypothetical protein